MDVNTFYSYTLNERMELLKKEGQYISRIPFYGYIVNLYIYDRFYIEVYYNRDQHDISQIELLDPKHTRLNQFAVLVDLSDLYRK